MVVGDVSPTEPSTLAGLAPSEVATPHRRAVLAIRVLLSVIVVAVLFGVVIPRISGGGYDDILAQLGELDLGTILGLGAVWIAGLLLYALALRSCLRGLTTTQGLVLNAAGSSVSNLVPFGGVAGVGATYAIAMSWGYEATAVSALILSTGLFNFFVTLMLPTLALPLLVAQGRASWALAGAAATGVAVTVVTIAFLAVIERSERAALRISDRIQSMGTRVARTLRIKRELALGAKLMEFRTSTADILRSRWRPLAASVGGYRFCQFVLLLMCIHAIDPSTTLSAVDVFAAYAFGRILSTVPVTPAGVGVVETGTIAALVALGGEPVATSAAVLLFSSYVFVMELPLGGAAWLLWVAKRSWRRPLPSAAGRGPSPEADPTPEAETTPTPGAVPGRT